MCQALLVSNKETETSSGSDDKGKIFSDTRVEPERWLKMDRNLF